MEKKTILWKAVCGVVVVALAVLLLSGLLNNHDVRYHKDALPLHRRQHGRQRQKRRDRQLS